MRARVLQLRQERSACWDEVGRPAEDEAGPMSLRDVTRGARGRRRETAAAPGSRSAAGPETQQRES